MARESAGRGTRDVVVPGVAGPGGGLAGSASARVRLGLDAEPGAVEAGAVEEAAREGAGEGLVGAGLVPREEAMKWRPARCCQCGYEGRRRWLTPEQGISAICPVCKVMRRFWIARPEEDGCLDVGCGKEFSDEAEGRAGA